MKPDPIADALQAAFERGVAFAAEQCDGYARILRGPVDDVAPLAQETARRVFDIRAQAAEEIASSLRKALASRRDHRPLEARSAQGQVS